MLLTTKTETHRDTWLELADERLSEFEILRAAGKYAGAFYLAGYVVEALLKRCICKTLDVEELPLTYRSHDLEALLLHSGLQRAMRANPDIIDSFHEIAASWKETIRYERPSTIGEANCNRMAELLTDPSRGVVPWLKARI